MPSINELTGQDATDLAAIATANGAAKNDLSNVTPATGLAALGAAKSDLSNVTAATGRAALNAASLAGNTFTGDQNVTGNQSIAGNLSLTSTDPGASASPLITLYRDSASPAALDTMGEVDFNGRNSSNVAKTYGRIVGVIIDPTAASEDGMLQLQTMVAGTLTNRWYAQAGFYAASLSDPGVNNIAAEKHYAASGVFWSSGSGSPESAVTAPVGSLYSRTDGGATTTLYVKTSGAGNTGWTAK